MIKDNLNKFDNPFLKQVDYYLNGKIVGSMKYSIMYERMELEDIFVIEEYQNQKIATKLMSYLISEAINNRVVNITLEVRETNSIAIKLYKNFGFREMALRHNYYKNENGILMEKQVM